MEQVMGNRTEELKATTEVLHSSNFLITDEEADRLLSMEIEIEDEVFVKQEDLEVYPTSDTTEDLMNIALSLDRTRNKNKGKQKEVILELIFCLCTNRVLEKVVVDGERVWISAEEINDLFDVPDYQKSKGHLAWYLSQPPESFYHYGEWFERRGKFIRNSDGSRKMSPSGAPKFRTQEYRITKHAVDAILALRKKARHD